MATSKNRLRFDYKDLPDLQAALGGLVPGDRCKIELDLMVVSNDDGGLEGDIEGVEYDIPSEDGDDTETGSAEPSAEEPVMAVIARRKEASKKSAKPAKEEKAVEEDI